VIEEWRHTKPAFPLRLARLPASRPSTASENVPQKKNLSQPYGLHKFLFLIMYKKTAWEIKSVMKWSRWPRFNCQGGTWGGKAREGRLMAPKVTDAM
jgi:hypothetical protein